MLRNEDTSTILGVKIVLNRGRREGERILYREVSEEGEWFLKVRRYK